jgi:hypothetical protein
MVNNMLVILAVEVSVLTFSSLKICKYTTSGQLLEGLASYYTLVPVFVASSRFSWFS